MQMCHTLDLYKGTIILQTKQKEIMKNSYESFHQEIQLAADEALVLSHPNQIDFPTPTEIRQTIFSTLASFATFSKINNNLEPIKQFLPIPNEFFLMACGNVIRIYKHSQTIQQQLQCEIITEIELTFYIKCVKISPFSKFKKDKGILLLVEDLSSVYLQTLSLEVSDKSIKPLSMTHIPSVINCWSFIHNRQILIWAQNMYIYHYELLNSGLKLVQSLNTGIELKSEFFVEKQQTSTSRSKSKTKGHSLFKPAKEKKKSPFVLNYCQILGQRGKEQDSIIVLFYVLYNEEFNGMKIKCKQILYPFQTGEAARNYQFFTNYAHNQFPKLKIYPQTHQIVSHNTASPEVLQAMNIIKIEEAFLIRFEFEIIVVQKKFNQEYMVINNIYKKNKGCKVSMAYNSNIVTCITNSILELNKIEIVENTIQRNMIDFIDLDNQYRRFIDIFKERKEDHKGASQIKWLKDKSKLFMLWVTTDLVHEQHRNQINLVFEVCFQQNQEEKKAYFLYNTKHTPRVKKLTALAHKAQKPEDIKSIQKLGKSLGINEAQFYYNMWKTSSHNYDDVLMYLLKCKDYIKIITELKGFLRKKSYAATKLQKILLKLEEMALQLLQEKLTQQHLVDYFHVLFVNRKFQIYESNYEIDERQFTETVQISIYDLFRKIINQALFTVTKSDSVWASEPKKPPKLNLIQVLGYFKLPLLEDYDIFLEKVLTLYPHNIVDVISHFPELLPNYPFEDLIPAENSSSSMLARVNSFQKLTEKQKEFFSPIKSEHIKAESNFLDNILEKLYPYYSTSLIKKSFDQASSRTQIKNQKFIFHSIISTSKENYKNKLKAMSTKNPIYLYNVALNCLVKVGRQAKSQEDYLYNKYKKITQLCQIFREVHKIEKGLVDEMQIMASFFQLIIYHEIIDANEFSLNQIVSEPIQKWIALFFLGNKQQKDVIFNDFMDIYTQKKSEHKFIQALKKFIQSEHCSKIQLCILIDLINHMNKDFQRKNQKIIDLIVDGFCSRVEISDIADATNFKQRLCKIQLGQQLLLKADKIEKMSLCRCILSNFYLEDTLIKDLLENTTDVLNKILENFFAGKMKDSNQIKFGTAKKSFSIEIKEIIDMFRLLHFLRENVFYNLNAQELVKIYCKKLILWQRFDEIHQLLYDSQEIKQYDIDLHKTIAEIQGDTLEELQRLEDFMFTHENKLFINKILEIDRDPTNNATVIKMRARIAISEIFLDWKIAVKSSQLEQMCRQWQKIANEVTEENPLDIKQRDIMDEIIQTYAEHLNVKSLEQLYKYFMIAVTNNPNPETKTQRFYRYCTSLCDALLTHHRYKEASEIICIVNQMFEMNYQLMTECMLQSVCAIYIRPKPHEQSRLDIINNSVISSLTQEKKEDMSQFKTQQKQDHIEKTPARRILADYMFQNDILKSQESSQEVQQFIQPIEIVKLYVHYFVINWIQNDEEGMNKIYSSYFDVDLQTIPTLPEVQVHPDLCFNEFPGKIKTKVLWQVIKQAYENACSPEPISQEGLICCYFFTVMGLFQPEIGFTEIDYINYDHKMLVHFLSEVMKLCEKGRKQLLFLDYSIIFKKYLDALTKLLILKYQQNNPGSDEIEESTDKPDIKQVKNLMDLSIHHLKSDNLSIIREQFLKTGEYKDDPLINCINKLRILTQQAQKNCKKRSILHNTKSVKAFSLTGNQSKLKMTMRKNMKNFEKEVQNNDKIKTKQEQHMMSFEQFKEIKKTIKDLSHMEIGDLDISERLIVEKFFDQVEPSKNKLKSKKQIPELEQIIATSLKELEEREIRQRSRQRMEKSEQQPGFGPKEQEIRQAQEPEKQAQAREEGAKKEANSKISSLFFSFKGGLK